MDNQDVIERQLWNNITIRKGNLAACCSLDGTGEYHVKWHKGEEEGQIMSDLSHLWQYRNIGN